MTADERATEDEIIATLSDYLDGVVPADRRRDVEAKLADDADWQRVHAELLETRNALSGLQRARAPESFAQDVTATIHKRSAGRFFGRRTFGDRVPFGALLVVALIALGIVGFMLWSSSTGSLKPDPEPVPPPAEGSQSLVPTP